MDYLRKRTKTSVIAKNKLINSVFFVRIKIDKYYKQYINTLIKTMKENKPISKSKLAKKQFLQILVAIATLAYGTSRVMHHHKDDKQSKTTGMVVNTQPKTEHTAAQHKPDPQKNQTSHPSHKACLKMIKGVIGNNTHIDPYNKSCVEALHTAAEWGHVDIIQTLIDAGINMNAPDKYGDTALEKAVFHGHTDVVKALLDRSITIKTTKNRPILHEAVFWERTDIIQLLIDFGVDVNETDRYGNTALHIAAAQGSEKNVHLLINAKANTNSKNIFGITPLHEAVKQQHIHIIQTLLKHGVDANESDSHGRTALHLSVQMKNPDIVKVLLNAKVKTNIQDKDGSTAMDKAQDLDHNKEREFIIHMLKEAIKKNPAQNNIAEKDPSDLKNITPLVAKSKKTTR